MLENFENQKLSEIIPVEIHIQKIMQKIRSQTGSTEQLYGALN